MLLAPGINALEAAGRGTGRFRRAHETTESIRSESDGRER